MSILICYDGSPSSAHAVSVAHQTLESNDVVLLHVWNPPAKVLADAFSTKDAGSGPSYPELEALSLRRAQEVTDEGCRLAAQHGLDVSARQEPNSSTVWQTILDVAGQVDAKLIVVGTHGATAVEHALLGSVSNSLLHHSERPVLVVPVRSGE